MIKLILALIFTASMAYGMHAEKHRKSLHRKQLETLQLSRTTLRSFICDAYDLEGFERTIALGQLRNSFKNLQEIVAIYKQTATSRQQERRFENLKQELAGDITRIKFYMRHPAIA